MAKINWTLVIAVWGALAGTASGIYNLVLLLEKRRSVRVRLRWTEGRQHLILDAVNTGRPVVLGRHGLVLPSGAQCFPADTLGTTRFPGTLAADDKGAVRYRFSDVVEELRVLGCSGTVRLRGFIEDRTERKYTSAPLDIRV